MYEITLYHTVGAAWILITSSLNNSIQTLLILVLTIVSDFRCNCSLRLDIKYN